MTDSFVEVALHTHTGIPRVLRYHDGRHIAICETCNGAGTLIINGTLIGTYPSIEEAKSVLEAQGINTQRDWSKYR